MKILFKLQNNDIYAPIVCEYVKKSLYYFLRNFQGLTSHPKFNLTIFQYSFYLEEILEF